MEKRILLASVLSLLILLGYNAVIGKHLPKQAAQAVAPTNLSVPNQAIPEAVSEAKKPTLVSPISLESKELETKRLKVVFTNLGGKISEIWLKDYNVKFFAPPVLGPVGAETLPFKFTSATTDAITLTFQDANRKITKNFQIKDDYFINVEISSQDLNNNKTAISEINCFNLDLDSLNKDLAFQKEKLFSEVAISLPDKVLRTNIGKVNSKTRISLSEKVGWLGLREKYFCVLFKPEFTTTGYFIRSGQNNTVDIGLSVAAPSGLFTGVLYIGPQDAKILVGANSGLEQIVSLGTFDPISKFMLKILGFLHNIIPNWGLCIIAFSGLIFFALYPLTLKSMKSMREMQKTQPQIAALKKQYQSDPQRLNKEIMELYRVHKINPFGGCLPLILQIPVFFALYQALIRSLDLKGSGFLWIKDLSEPDRLMVFNSSIPILGNELNLLPLLMAGVMFFQQKASMKTTVAADPQQQKLMMIFFPILFGFMFYRFPSGLSLYWVVYSGLSLFFQWKQTAGQKN
ncbi:MAG: membrane protein insertase YidC [Candidatus Omnitrophota bacterium]|nr:membrane protein insertase YidC [Candidatus Omnitrophota bacterium]